MSVCIDCVRMPMRRDGARARLNKPRRAGWPMDDIILPNKRVNVRISKICNKKSGNGAQSSP